MVPTQTESQITNLQIQADITRMNKRSAVRRWVTYALLWTYVATASILIGLFIFKALNASDEKITVLYLEVALAIFSGVSAAALGVIGYWFGSRDISKDAELIGNQYSSIISRNSISEGGGYDGGDIKFPGDNDKLHAAYHHAVSEFMGKPGVTGVDMGFKYVNGRRTDQIVLRVHVKDKRPVSDLNGNEVIPGVYRGVPVDVIELQGVAESVVGRAPVDQPLDILQPGIRIQSAAATDQFGTLGALVRKNSANDELFFLTCAHVLLKSLGDSSPSVYQPGPDEVHTIGALKLWHYENGLDAALVKLDGRRNATNQPYGIEQPLTSARMPSWGETLQKIGARSGDTDATVDGMGTHTLYNSQLGNIEVECFILKPKGLQRNFNISMGGDSGAIWFDPSTGAAVGLHFMGNSGNNPDAAYAINMPYVLSELDVELV